MSANAIGVNRFLRYSMKWKTLPCLVATLVMGLSPTCRAQVNVGTLSGTVKSESGAGIARVQVTLKNSETGISVSVTTNLEGSYRAEGLQAGTYEVIVSAPGFATARATIAISAGTDKAWGVVLVAAGKASVAEAGSATITNTMSSQSARDIPLNGRSASDLAALEAGVSSARTQATGQGQYGFGAQMTISGGRPRQNDSRLDAISVNDYANGSPGSALGVNLGIDSVEQFSVLTSNYPAQDGRSSGGIIGASTRTGTNSFHGDVFEFLRNSVFDARNFFDTQKPPFWRNQFGTSAGGPIRKDTTFIFGDYEGLRQSQGITQVDTVPSPAARAGLLCSIPQGPPNPCSPTQLPAGSNTDANGIDLAAKAYLGLYPLPNGTILGNGDTGVFTFAGQRVTPENYFTAKLDQKSSEHDSLSGTYMFDSGIVRQPDELNVKRTGYDSRRHFFTASETHRFGPGFVNAARLGVNRVVARTGLTFAIGNPLAEDKSLAAVPGQNAAILIVPGLTKLSGGLGALSNFRFHWMSLQAADDISAIRGKHSIKLGGNLERIRDNMLGDSNPAGEFTFNSLSDFLTNKPFLLAATVPSAISERGIRQTIFGIYIQDDWRLRPNLTASLGLRYEAASVPTEVQGKLTVLRNLTDSTPHLGDPLISNPTLRNFEPRLGFSWDPFRNGKTAVSGGFGIFDVLPLPYLFQFNELFSAPFYRSANATNLPAGTFPSQAFAIAAASSSSLRQAFFETHPKRDYVMQWNLTVQRQLATDLHLRVSYVGSRGVHQPFRTEDADIVLPTLTPAGYLWPSPQGSGTRLNESAGRITAAFWEADSYYDALQTQIKMKIGRGSQFGVSYTWGKTIDTGSGSLVGDEYSNSISSPLFFDTRTNRGLADFNVSQKLNVNYMWTLGIPNWKSALAEHALGGWQVGGILEASTGVPFTPGFAGDTLGTRSTDANIDVPNVLGGGGCASLVNSGNPAHYIRTQCFTVPSPITLRGNLGRNTLIGPGLLNFDFSLIKNNYVKRISDAFNVQFRAEFFNVLNHTNFVPPLDNRNLFDKTGQPIANAGLITSTETPSRQIQFALKLIW